MQIQVRQYRDGDLAETVEVWNRVVRDGEAFPQLDELDAESGSAFFAEQSFVGVAVGEGGEIVGMYILHPNNIGRCGHIANASYAVKADRRGMHIGETLVRHSLAKAKELGFGIMQFNAVVATNHSALHLYEKIGFTRLGTIPRGFRMDDGGFRDIVPHFIEL